MGSKKSTAAQRSGPGRRRAFVVILRARDKPGPAGQLEPEYRRAAYYALVGPAHRPARDGASSNQSRSPGSCPAWNWAELRAVVRPVELWFGDDDGKRASAWVALVGGLPGSVAASSVSALDDPAGASQPLFRFTDRPAFTDFTRAVAARFPRHPPAYCLPLGEADWDRIDAMNGRGPTRAEIYAAGCEVLREVQEAICRSAYGQADHLSDPFAALPVRKQSDIRRRVIRRMAAENRVPAPALRDALALAEAVLRVESVCGAEAAARLTSEPGRLRPGQVRRLLGSDPDALRELAAALSGR